MKYSEYENNVLEKLNELLKIISKYVSKNTIRLNFANDFHYEFDRQVLNEAYRQGYPEDFIARRIKENIRSQFVDTFLERKIREKES